MDAENPALCRRFSPTGANLVIRPRPPETAVYRRSLAHNWRTRRLDIRMQVTKDPSTNLRGSPRGWWSRRLFGLGPFALVAVLAAALPGGGIARADPVQHIWVHYDYMVAADGRSDAPDPAAIQLVVEAFAAHGIQLHIDPQHSAIPETEFVIFKGEGFGYADCGVGQPVEFSDLKAQYFHPTSDHPWHYAIFGYNGGTCASGIADLPGDDFFISMSDLPILDQFPRDRRLDFEGGRFMHELGHNLNLRHGGDEDLPNGKPNYLSVMNYSYQNGIPYAASPGSTTVLGYRLDYSEQTLPPLDENNLNESLGIQDPGSTDIVKYFFPPPPDEVDCFFSLYGWGRPALGPASGPIDWNQDGVTTETNLAQSINGDGGCEPLGLLTGFNDWAEVHQYLADQDKHPKNPGPPQS
jgi:hypothetical protein